MAAQKDVAVECIAEEARPPPTFSWYLGEDLLNVSRKFLSFYRSSCEKIKFWYYSQYLHSLLNCQGEISASAEDASAGKKNYIETLRYYPSWKHDGKILRCQVEHQAYTDIQKEGKENEAEVVLRVQCMCLLFWKAINKISKNFI